MNIPKNSLVIIGLMLGLSACSSMKGAYNSAFGTDGKAAPETTASESSGFSTSKNAGKMPETACQIAYKQAFIDCVEKTKTKDQTASDALLTQCMKDKGFGSYNANCTSPTQ